MRKSKILTFSGIFLFFSLSLSATGCGGAHKKSNHLGYTESASQLFDNAMMAFERERWTDAQKLFADVQSKFPYSQFAALALLREADCQFNLGNHAESAVTYQHFLKTYPTHVDAHYAAFKKGKAYVEQIPGEFFFTPPAYERDQTATRDARSALARFLRDYPDSEYVKEAKDLYTEVENALVRHEMYVARFYLSRQKLKSAAVRLASIGEQFPNSLLVPNAMFLEAITYLEMGRPKKARHTFRTIIERYPGHLQARRAKAYIDALPNI